MYTCICKILHISHYFNLHIVYYKIAILILLKAPHANTCPHSFSEHNGMLTCQSSKARVSNPASTLSSPYLKVRKIFPMRPPEYITCTYPVLTKSDQHSLFILQTLHSVLVICCLSYAFLIMGNMLSNCW